MKIFNFRIEENILKELKKKYRNVSGKLRELIKRDLKGSGEQLLLKRNDWKGLKKLIENSPALQIYGDIGIGKTTLMKKIIKNDGNHIYVVFDAHQEYGLLYTDSISKKLRRSSGIKLPKQVAGAKGVFPLYVNQILSKKWSNKFIFVVEEAHRYNSMSGLLSEARKFAKVISISQDRLVPYVPSVKIIK